MSEYGLQGMTDWTGEVLKRADQKYDVYIVAFFVMTPEVVAQLGDNPDMDAIHSILEFSADCNTLSNTIDTYMGYIPWTQAKNAFVDDPDYDYLALWGIPTITETCQRLPASGARHSFVAKSNHSVRLNNRPLRKRR